MTEHGINFLRNDLDTPNSMGPGITVEGPQRALIPLLKRVSLTPAANIPASLEWHLPLGEIAWWRMFPWGTMGLRVNTADSIGTASTFER